MYFSDYFGLSEDTLESYSALNISLVNDLPLFIDPFHLFNSKKNKYQQLHKDIITYLTFLRDKSIEGNINIGLLKAWYCFKEVKQNWLGFSLFGNSGRGLGLDFAQSLNKNLNVIFSDFGNERIAKDSHLEKVCLLQEGIGKDKISDFTTNLIKHYLLNYTQRFARKYIKPSFCKKFVIEQVRFNYETESWESGTYYLPCCNNDYVILTPKDILTKEDIWIGKSDMLKHYDQVVRAVENQQLRSQLNNYLRRRLKDNMTAKQKKKVISNLYEKYPLAIEYYIRSKERKGQLAKVISERKVSESELLYIKQVVELAKQLQTQTSFYNLIGDTYKEAREKVLFMKDVIENKGGHRYFYVNGVPIRREEDCHIMFRLTWCGSFSDVSREVNDGRGSVDFKISRGAFDKTLVEFKLASNTKLKRNLDKQVPIYKKASDTNKAMKVIVYFSNEELEKVQTILKDLRKTKDKDIILIDARADNKPSASVA